MTEPRVPMRDGSRYGNPAPRPLEHPCPVCGRARPSRRARYCSEACQQRAYRLRHTRPVDTAGLVTDLHGRRQLVAQTVYECPTCDARFLGERRCSECNRFCRALGLGGACPDCDRLILLDELLGR